MSKTGRSGEWEDYETDCDYCQATIYKGDEKFFDDNWCDSMTFCKKECLDKMKGK